MKDEIRNRVSDVISEVLRIPLSEDHNLVRDQTAEWDSLKHLEIILALEDEFQVRFTAEQTSNIQSLEDIVTILGDN